MIRPATRPESLELAGVGSELACRSGFGHCHDRWLPPEGGCECPGQHPVSNPTEDDWHAMRLLANRLTDDLEMCGSRPKQTPNGWSSSSPCRPRPSTLPCPRSIRRSGTKPTIDATPSFVSRGSRTQRQPADARPSTKGRQGKEASRVTQAATTACREFWSGDCSNHSIRELQVFLCEEQQGEFCVSVLLRQMHARRFRTDPPQSWLTRWQAVCRLPLRDPPHGTALEESRFCDPVPIPQLRSGGSSRV